MFSSIRLISRRWGCGEGAAAPMGSCLPPSRWCSCESGAFWCRIAWVAPVWRRRAWNSIVVGPRASFPDHGQARSRVVARFDKRAGQYRRGKGFEFSWRLFFDFEVFVFPNFEPTVHLHDLITGIGELDR